MPLNALSYHGIIHKVLSAKDLDRTESHLHAMPWPCSTPLGAHHDLVVVEWDRYDALLCNRLHVHALEINRHPPLQLVRTHAQDLDALLEGDVRVVVLVEDGEAVVPI